jgi:hypothetical protein
MVAQGFAVDDLQGQNIQSTEAIVELTLYCFGADSIAMHDRMNIEGAIYV